MKRKPKPLSESSALIETKKLNFQRAGEDSNTAVGRDFERVAQEVLAREGIPLEPNLKLKIGIENIWKQRTFDLGSQNLKVIVECKSHRWTSGDNVPSAKMTVWNEAMYFFSLAPISYKKILFVLRDFSEGRKESLAEYYVRTYDHLIPKNVAVLEYDEDTGRLQVIRGRRLALLKHIGL